MTPFLYRIAKTFTKRTVTESLDLHLFFPTGEAAFFFKNI